MDNLVSTHASVEKPTITLGQWHESYVQNTAKTCLSHVTTFSNNDYWKKNKLILYDQQMKHANLTALIVHVVTLVSDISSSQCFDSYMKDLGIVRYWSFLFHNTTLFNDNLLWTIHPLCESIVSQGRIFQFVTQLLANHTSCSRSKPNCTIMSSNTFHNWNEVKVLSKQKSGSSI